MLTPEMAGEASVLRERVLEELATAGFDIAGGGIREQVGSPDEMKTAARRLHETQRKSVLVKNARFVAKWEEKLLPQFASGSDVVPERIEPTVVPVRTDAEAALFRLASLHWSVPVSQGYGRRTRFLIMDATNGKLMGIFALGDPVFNLGSRDRLIGWTGEQRKRRLYNCFDAYVLGAVEPYRYLIAGKLAALLAASNETADYLAAKYEGATTVIRGEEKSARPVLISTTSALGRSSIYNRLKFRDEWVFRSIGFTEGFGHFHFSDDLFDDLLHHMQDAGVDVRGHKFGDGPNWRIRTLRTALDRVGLSGDLLKHGVRREIFLAPRGMGWRAFLRGETDTVHWFDYGAQEMAHFWRERWAVPRAKRDDAWRAHEAESMRIAPQIAAHAAHMAEASEADG